MDTNVDKFQLMSVRNHPKQSTIHWQDIQKSRVMQRGFALFSSPNLIGSSQFAKVVEDVEVLGHGYGGGVQLSLIHI